MSKIPTASPLAPAALTISGGLFANISVLTTIIFVILKLTDAVDWSWLTVFLPLLIAASLSVVGAVVLLILVVVLAIAVRVSGRRK